MEDTSTPTATTTSAPTSFAEAASTLEASSASTPEPTTQTADPAAPAATTQAASEPVRPGSEGVSTETPVPLVGEPPKWRWQDILANREKKTEERIRQEFAWAKDIPAEHLASAPNALKFSQWLDRDPQAAYTWLGQQIGMSGQTTTTQPSVAAMPEPDLQAQDGTLVYSAPQMQKLREWDETRLLGKFDERLKPLQSAADRVAASETSARAHYEVGTVLTEFRADPDFKAHEADIKAELANDAKLAQLADRDPKQALEIAFGRVYRAKVVPTLSTKERASVLADLSTKPNATTVNPGHTTVTLPRKPKDFYEAAEMYAQSRTR